MKADWTATTLGSICKFQAGDGFPKDLQGDVDGEYPVAKVSDMNLAGNELFIINANNWLSKKAVDQAFKLHPSGAVIFAKIGIALTSNRRRILVRPTVIDNNMMSATCTKDIDPRWFYSLLTMLDFNQVSSGSALPFLTVRDLSKIPISVPPLPEQRAIAATLGALDDKIELNRKMNATMESVARALFRDWFVDFGPTRAKMEGRAPYLSLDLWSLFPDRLDDEGKPEGWEVRAIRENCTRITNGGTPKRDVPEYWQDGHIPWLSSGEVRQKLILTTSSYITDRGMRASSAKLVASGSSVVALYGATAGQVSYLAAEVTTNQAVCSLTPKLGFRAFNFLKLSSETETLLGMATGSAQQNLSKALVENFPALTAPQAIMDAFEATVAPWLEKMVQNERESRTLAQTRDLLLPRLMSGELRVAEAERMVEAAQ